MSAIFNLQSSFLLGSVKQQYKSIKPLGDRVLVKINSSEEKTTGGVLLPTSAQSKPQAGEAVAIGEGKTVGQKKVEIGVEAGTQVVYSKYAGTEVEFNGCKHLLLKEDDIVGVLDTDDVRDLRPSNDRILIKVAEAEERTAGGLLLTAVVKERPSTATLGQDPWKRKASDSHCRYALAALSSFPSLQEASLRVQMVQIM